MSKNTKTKSNTEESAASILGRRGGIATAKKGKKHMREIGKAGAAKRWAPKI